MSQIVKALEVWEMSVSRMVRLAEVLIFYALVLFVTPPAFAQCNVQTPIGPNDSVVGTLSSGDCTAQELTGDPFDTSFVDLYRVSLPSNGTLTVRMDSDIIDPFLVLANLELTSFIATDDDSGGNFNALISVTLAAGTYIIAANSAFLFPQTGPYTLTTTCNCGPPIAANDSYSVIRNRILAIAAPGLLANDSDPAGSSLIATVASEPSNGTLSLSSSGAFTYTPNSDFTGIDTFTYRASTGVANSNVATVTITVEPVKAMPWLLLLLDD